jgi:WhiB family redox-sensing transcriptional regulator
MQLATFDRETEQPELTGSAVATLAALTGLSALTERVDDDQLPCRVNDPELFFADSPADVEFAKTLCANCPVRLDCLNGALERREPWGVWGGEWFVQGVVVPRKRPRGRPRKSEVAA